MGLEVKPGEKAFTMLKAVGCEGKFPEQRKIMFRGLGKELEGLDIMGTEGKEVFKNELLIL